MNRYHSFVSQLAGYAATCALVLAFAAPVAAQSAIVQIEEHWELAIGEPDVQLSAPQATMVMSPAPDLNDQYFVFTLNHRDLPEYEPGGLQVQLWNGDDVDATASSSAAPLDQTNDTISWVQRLKVEDGTLTLEVVDGTSSSWGNFGGDDTLEISTPTTLTNLNGYRPAISLGESQVNYAGNRVQRLLLKKLVWTTADGQVHELQAPIDIDADLDP